MCEIKTKCDVCGEKYDDDEINDLDDVYFVCNYCIESFDQCCGDKCCESEC